MHFTTMCSWSQQIYTAWLYMSNTTQTITTSNYESQTDLRDQKATVAITTGINASENTEESSELSLLNTSGHFQNKHNVIIDCRIYLNTCVCVCVCVRLSFKSLHQLLAMRDLELLVYIQGKGSFAEQWYVFSESYEQKLADNSVNIMC